MMEMTVARPARKNRFGREWLERMIADPPEGSVVADVTPELAGLILEDHNSRNRNPSPRMVSLLSQDLRDGHWKVTGETIIFATDGQINSGQNRLKACADTGIGFRSHVVFGIEPEASSVTDTGKKRSPQDALQTAGESNTSTLSAVLQWVGRWEQTNGSLSKGTNQISNREILALLEEHPGVRKSVLVGRRVWDNLKGYPPGVAGFCHYMIVRETPKANRPKVDAFFDQLTTGLNLRSTRDPIYRLRRRLVERGKGRSNLRYIDMIAFTFKAWNAYVRGEEVVSLHWRQTGPAAEPMPSPQ